MHHIVAKYMSLPCRENSDGRAWQRLPESDLDGASRWQLRKEERDRAQERSRVEALIDPQKRAAALEVLRPYAKQIHYNLREHTLQVRFIRDAETRERIKDALEALGSAGCGESGRLGGMVTATGSIINRLVVAEQIRAGGIEFQGMPPLPPQVEQGRA